MNRLANLAWLLVLMLSPFAAMAQDFNGKKPLICSTIEVYDCEPGGDCIRGQAQDIGAPQFFFLDFEKGMAKTVRAGSDERTSPIKTVQTESGELILQGAQSGRAWSATIGQESGTLVLSVAGDGVAFVLFGACTPM